MNAKEYRRQQDKALNALLRQIRLLLVAYGVPATDAQREQLALLLWRSVRNARERNYDVAKAYIASELVAADVPDLPGFPLAAMITGIERATKGLLVDEEPVTAANRKSPRVVDAGRRAVGGQVSRQAQEPARNVVQELAENTEGLGWARMLTGATSCAFCAMLASRGPVYKSRESATGRGGSPLDLYHSPYVSKSGKLVGGDCDCIAVLVRPDGSFEGADAAERLEDLWQAATRRRSNKDARNAFRRSWDQKVRDGESGEYIADTMK